MITLTPNGATIVKDAEIPPWIDIVATYLIHTQAIPADGLRVMLPNGWVYLLRRVGQGHEWRFVSRPEQVTGVLMIDEEREIV